MTSISFCSFSFRPLFLLFHNPSYPLTSLRTGEDVVRERTRYSKTFPLSVGRISERLARKHASTDGSLQDFSTFIERIGSAHYFSKSSRNGNSKRIISGPPFSLPLPKWRNIVGDESGGVERYKGGGGCRV